MSMTVGELRKMLRDLPDSMEVMGESGGSLYEALENLTVVGVSKYYGSCGRGFMIPSHWGSDEKASKTVLLITQSPVVGYSSLRKRKA